MKMTATNRIDRQGRDRGSEYFNSPQYLEDLKESHKEEIANALMTIYNCSYGETYELVVAIAKQVGVFEEVEYEIASGVI